LRDCITVRSLRVFVVWLLVGTQIDFFMLQLQMSSKQMFEAMQNQGFFCSLPSDPAQTHMECKPMPK
jgi:hypothetical protein